MTRFPPALRHRDFRLFWGGAVVSALGSAFTSIALLWHLFLLTNSALQVGLIGLAQAIPLISLSLFGGLLADAIDRRRLMIVTQVVQFSISGGLAVLTILGLVSPPFLYVAAALFALASALEGPSRSALVPNLVPAADLSNAIALNSTQRSVAAIVGPALAGILLALSGPTLCYAIDALSWFAMLAALLSIRSRPQATGGRRAVSFEALRDGITFVRSNSVILSMMVLDFGATLFGEPDALRGRVSAVNSIFVIGGPRLSQVESGVVAAFGGAPFSAFTGGIGALLVVLGIALVPGVRRFSLGDEPRMSLA